jgi:hypothetical protein
MYRIVIETVERMAVSNKEFLTTNIVADILGNYYRNRLTPPAYSLGLAD